MSTTLFLYSFFYHLLVLEVGSSSFAYFPTLPSKFFVAA
jgi:hypothetical protein